MTQYSDSQCSSDSFLYQSIVRTDGNNLQYCISRVAIGVPSSVPTFKYTHSPTSLSAGIVMKFA